MHCDRCHKPVPADATIWRVSIGYSLVFYPPGVQSWCATCASDRHYHRWHPAQPCDHCGRPVIFDGARRIPLHAVCGEACRYALRLVQARASRRAGQRPPLICTICGRTFQSKRRADALTCSHVCRQRAYRQRQHAEVV
jgi:hypothetical protein